MLVRNVREVTLVQDKEILSLRYVQYTLLIVTKKELANALLVRLAMSVLLFTTHPFHVPKAHSLLKESVKTAPLA